MLTTNALELAGLLLLTPERHGDERGFFSEVYRRDQFEAVAGPIDFVQDNHSRSLGKGVVRGLHFQRPPYAQGKLVRVSRGAVIDVAVDVRQGSPTYGKHLTVALSENNGHQLWIPAGFLHGFCSLTDDVEFQYKVDAFYNPEHDGAVAFDDPELKINWPFPRDALTLSDKDFKAPNLADIPPPFPKGWENMVKNKSITGDL